MPYPQRRPVATILVCLALTGVGCARTELKGVGNVHTVEPGVLVRGGQPDAAGFRALQREYGIGTVVNLNDLTAMQEETVVTALGMSYVALPSSAWQPDAEKLRTFLGAMADARDTGPVYVHCKHGMDRTGLAVAAYRIVVQGWDAERALAELRSHQEFPHAQMFPALAPMVRHVGACREAWAAALKPPASVPPSPASPLAPPDATVVSVGRSLPTVSAR
jgi:protein tyrosine phosphatase (PTP) superfamily phosphohydrolase (DUF442 family)